MKQTKALLMPGKIGTLEVKNRVIMSPMATGYPNVDGYVDDRLVDYLAARAKGGCGLVGMEFTAVTASGQPPTLPSIYDDSFLPGVTKVAEAIKANGGRAMIQLAHCGRQTYGDPPNGPALAASPIPCAGSGTVGREMTEEEIRETIEAFGDAALRAIKAGFEAIEIHCAHGYLIQNFLSPYSNKRTDRWGGSFENRSRFAREVMRNVRKKVGPDYPLLTRVSWSEPTVEGGLELEEQIKFCQMLEAEGSDLIDVSVGVYGYQHYLIPPIDMPLGLNVEAAAEIKKHVNIPVSVVGRINDPVLAENLVASGKVDFVSIGRGLIADPEFVNKFEQGNLDDIVKCIGCMEGCFKRSGIMPITCLRNPEAGNEKPFALKPAEQKKKVLVVGGGPGGLEIATRLQRRGHSVTLMEKTSSLGGLFQLAGAAPRKGEMLAAAHQMGRIAQRAGVKIQLQTEVTPEIIQDFAPNVVIVATGSKPFIPPIPGVDGENVLGALDVLRGTKTTGHSVVVIGGNVIGCEVADLLSANGKEVTVIEAASAVATGLDFVRMTMMHRTLAEQNVTVITDAKCSRIAENSVSYEKEGQESVILGVDSVVIATGVKSYDPLSAWLTEQGIEHYVIGDAKTPGYAIDATQQAAELAVKI